MGVSGQNLMLKLILRARPSILHASMRVHILISYARDYGRLCYRFRDRCLASAWPLIHVVTLHFLRSCVSAIIVCLCVYKSVIYYRSQCQKLTDIRRARKANINSACGTRVRLYANWINGIVAFKLAKLNVLSLQFSNQRLLRVVVVCVCIVVFHER